MARKVSSWFKSMFDKLRIPSAAGVMKVRKMMEISGMMTHSRNLFIGYEMRKMRRKPIKQVERQESEVVSSHDKFMMLEMIETAMMAKIVARAAGTEFWMI